MTSMFGLPEPFDNMDEYTARPIFHTPKSAVAEDWIRMDIISSRDDCCSHSGYGYWIGPNSDPVLSYDRVRII